jgi:hypothetical protein
VSAGNDLEPENGSLHDPTSRVHVDGDLVVRGMSESAAEAVRALHEQPFYQRRVVDGSCIDSAFVDPAEVGLSEWPAAVRHRRLPVITYPHEWSFTMLRDAALLQLDLAIEALDAGLAMKDGTPYNVQFDGSRPMFIDIGSFDVADVPTPWLGYRQYCDMFLDPLLLQAYTGLPARGVLRGSVRGVPADVTRRLLPRRAKMRPSVFNNVVLHAWLSRRHERDEADVVGDIRKAGFSPAIARAQLRKLRSLTASLKWAPAASTWSDYSERLHYEGDDLAHKAEFVTTAANRTHRERILDLGANDGYFSDLVRDAADHVVAVDNDEVVIDRLYRKLRSTDDASITPLCIDLSDPSGGLGWMGQQRRPMTERLRSDLVLALALIHHVVISDSVPIPEFLAFLRALAPEAVVELPTEDDPKVVRLIRNKAGQPTHPYSRAVFEKELGAVYRVERMLELPSETRVLYHLTAR